MSDVLSATQKKWLSDMTGVMAQSENAIKDAANRLEGQETISKQMAEEAENLRNAFGQIKVQMKTNKVEDAFRDLVGKPKELTLMDPNHDPMKDFDTWADGPNLKNINEQDLAVLRKNYENLLRLQEQLKAENPYYAEPAKPEMPVEPSTPEQRKKYAKEMETYEADLKIAQRRMAEDLWNPLQREGLMPESFIPDKYSEVKRTFDEANVYYEERLQEYSKELGDYGKFMQHFDDAMAIGTGLLSVAGSAASFSSAIGTLTENKDVVSGAKEAAEIIGWVKIGMTSSAGIVKGALQEQDGFAVVEAINGAVSEILGATLDEETAALINGLVAGAIKTSKAGALFAKGDIDGGLDAIAESISSSMGGLGDDQVTEIGNIIGQSIKSLPKAKDAAKQFKDDPTGALVTLLGGAAELSATISAPKSEEVTGGLETATEHSETLDEVVKLAQQQKKVSGKIDKEKLEEKKEEYAKLQEENFQEFMRQEDRAFAEALEYGFADPDNEDEELDLAERRRVDSLERIVAVYKRDEMMFNLAKKIVAGGPGFVAELVPGMGLVAAVTQLVFSIGEAIKHAEQLVIWLENVGDAQKARTAQMDAMMNRLGLQKKQVIIANIKVGIQAVKVAGEATKLAGQAAPVGYAVAAGADLAESVLEVSAKVVEIAEMEKAWKDYKKALENPQNRKAIRQTMRSNPTLSKYAMAWGAVEDGNAIAKEAMRRCGLNARTLAQPETNVNKVVEYLEMIYADDPVLLRAVPVSDKWHPGDIEFEFRSFLKFYRAAVTDAKLAEFDYSGVSGALGGYETAAEAFAAEILRATKANAAAVVENEKRQTEASTKFRSDKEEWEKAGKTGEEPDYEKPDLVAIIEPDRAIYIRAVDSATTCMQAFGRLKPLNADGEAHASFQTYADAMEAKASIARNGFDGTWDKQEWMPANASTG
ncbi:MAG: hypothetical protein AAGG09_00035 [Pseudomonadota bacterium]